MPHPHRTIATISALALLGVAGCDSTTGPDLTLPPGDLLVAYSGTVDGVLSAEGALRLDDGRVTEREFAAAGANQYSPAEKLTVVGYLPGEDGEGTYFAISVPDLPAGTIAPIDVNCFDLECSATLLFFGVGPDRPHEDVEPEVDLACWINEGTLEITANDGERVAGTFSGTGNCVHEQPTDPLTPFEVDLGSFDVPVSRTYEPRIDLR